jgi:hypothetical protein
MSKLLPTPLRDLQQQKMRTRMRCKRTREQNTRAGPLAGPLSVERLRIGRASGPHGHSKKGRAGFPNNREFGSTSREFYRHRKGAETAIDPCAGKALYGKLPDQS